MRVRLLTVVALLSAALGCARRPAATPPPGPTAAVSAAPSATHAPAGPLPSVVAELSFALPGGDAYQPQALALDEAGQAWVLCYDDGTGERSALVRVDPAAGMRPAPLPLPGRSLGPLAVGGGRAYLGYEDGERRQRLAALDLATGQVVADVASEFLYSDSTPVATPDGRLILPLADRLEVRDGATLAVLGSLPYGEAATDSALAAGPGRERLYLAAGGRIRAYRTADLAPLWEAAGRPGRVRLTACQAGRRLYAQYEAYEGGELVVTVEVYEAESGRTLGALPAPLEPGVQLVAADSDRGHLVLAESAWPGVRLRQTDLGGLPTGAVAEIASWATGYTTSQERLFALVPGDHLLVAFDLASLSLLAEEPTGIEIRHLVADPARERVYLNDSAGRVHTVDTRTYAPLASVAAGRGELTLDADNGLLFVGREPEGHEVTVLAGEPLAATAVITGGYRVAVDSLGQRAFVGYTALRDPTPGEVQVWDTRTFQRLGAIAQRGEPAYNPLRNEVYLQDYSAYVVDGETLAVTGELTPDIGQTPPGLQGCNGCTSVSHIAVDPALDTIAVSLHTHATGGGPGTVLQPRLFSATTLELVSHTVTVLPRATGGPAPFILPADGGRVYEGQRFLRYVAYSGALAYEPGAAEPGEAREGLPLSLYLPESGVGLSAQQEHLLAFDAVRWQPLGWLPGYRIGEVDLAGHRLYAWQRAELTVLSFSGGQPPPSPPPAPLAAARGPVREIVLSPDYGQDRTIFAAAGQLLRSTDGGASWLCLQGGLPPVGQGVVAAYSLALSPTYGADRTLFAGGRVGEPVGLGVWRSTDGGETWTPAWAGLEHLRVERVVASPAYAHDRTLLAYCQYSEFWRGEGGTSLFQSTDGGEHWTRLATRPNAGDPPPLPRPEELLPYPAEPVRFRVSPQADAIERSTDGGASWREVLRRADRARLPLAVARADDAQVYALYPDRLFRSTDGGDTWHEAGDAALVREDYARYYTALAVGQGEGGRPVVALGDQAGAILVLDPAALHWLPAAAPPTPAPTATAAPPPPASPTPCALAPRGPAPARLGCAVDDGGEVQMAWQPFERGHMLWRADTREVYVLSTAGGANTWAAYADEWQEGLPDRDPALVPPAGLEQPIRGFGTVWREQLGGPQAAVGWARAAERGYGGYAQAFEHGLLLAAPEGRAYALFDDGSWQE
jgi:photosystem II stability/assembly factor-like uncharacterized protein